MSMTTPTVIRQAMANAASNCQPPERCVVSPIRVTPANESPMVAPPWLPNFQTASRGRQSVERRVRPCSARESSEGFSSRPSKSLQARISKADGCKHPHSMNSEPYRHRRPGIGWRVLLSHKVVILLVLLLNLKLGLGEGKNRNGHPIMTGREQIQCGGINWYLVAFPFRVGSASPAVFVIYKLDEHRVRLRCLWKARIQVHA